MKKHLIKFGFAFLAVFSACSLEQKGQNSGERPAANESVTIAPMTFRQVLTGFTALTETAIDNNLATQFNEAKNQLPAIGQQSEVTSATVLAATNLITRICVNFVTRERNNGNPPSRKVYREFNFNQEATMTDANVRAVANRLGNLFLGRNLEEAELVAAVAAKTNTLAGAPSTQRVFDASLVLCAGIGSSAESLTNL